MTDSQHPKSAAGQPEPVAAKKPYSTPTLTEFGNVAKLTMAKGTTQIEGAPNRKASCL